MKTTLKEALALMAEQLRKPLYILEDYAAEDSIGGFHHDPALRRWPLGSCWEVEGKLLYTMVRAIHPTRMYEIGTWYGCSTTHILAAMQRNHHGTLISFDLNGVQGDGPPEYLRNRWVFNHADANEAIQKRNGYPLPDNLSPDIVFEDGFHERDGTEETLRIVKELSKPKILMVHDSEHPGVGVNVRGAIEAVYGHDYTSVLIEPSDCGMAWCFNHD